MLTVFCTVTGSPENGGTEADLKALAMHPPVAVPAKGGPCTIAWVTRPEGAKVTETRATPLGSPAALHPVAWPIAPPSAAFAAPWSNGAPAGAVVAATVAVGFGSAPVSSGLGSVVVDVVVGRAGSVPVAVLIGSVDGALVVGGGSALATGAEVGSLGRGVATDAAWVAVAVLVALAVAMAGALGASSERVAA